MCSRRWNLRLEARHGSFRFAAAKQHRARGRPVYGGGRNRRRLPGKRPGTLVASPAAPTSGACLAMGPGRGFSEPPPAVDSWWNSMSADHGRTRCARAVR